MSLCESPPQSISPPSLSLFLKADKANWFSRALRHCWVVFSFATTQTLATTLQPKKIFICHSIEIHENIYIFLNMQPQVRTSQQSFPCTELPFSFHLNPSQSRCTAKAYQVIPAVRVQGTGEHSIAFCIRAFADKKKCLSK